MKKILLLPLFLCSVIASGQTQWEMNIAANESYKKADKELNKVYRKILSEYQRDTVFIVNLKKAQTIWIEFRDAELNMKYPEREQGWYGTVQPFCVNTYLEKLTRERTNRLKEWLAEEDEADLCGGIRSITEK